MSDSEIDIRTMTSDDSDAFMGWHLTKTGQFAHQFSYTDGDGQEYDCPSKILSDLLLAEYEFRTYAQLKEWISSEVGLKMQLSFYKNENRSWRSSCIDDRYIIDQYTMTEMTLYHKEAAMPFDTLRKVYDDLRKDPDWYMRKPLVHNCADRGGCCAHTCGCCEQRKDDLPRRGVSGHCTPGCMCCCDRKRQGQNWTSGEIDDIFKNEREHLESDSPFYLQYLASSYFKPLSPGFFHRRRSTSPTATATATESDESSIAVEYDEQKSDEGMDEIRDYISIDGALVSNPRNQGCIKVGCTDLSTTTSKPEGVA
ncbi:hypothetical protein PENSTE_c005G04522 [Penicillium steckii]|uniref:Uncharacterized protein n=1 Tax=Penicillium steckii TaxID=303698 RepID=A0A1V6TK96_9EURO|nr:hypothetical protein PENSTE_c005G04522 [Penicillium steckii]